MNPLMLENNEPLDRVGLLPVRSDVDLLTNRGLVPLEIGAHLAEGNPNKTIVNPGLKPRFTLWDQAESGELRFHVADELLKLILWLGHGAKYISTSGGRI